MGTLSKLEIVDSVGVIKMDAGKVNAFSHELIAELDQYFDELIENKEINAVVLQGKEGMFSGGFDLKVMMASMDARLALVKEGGVLLRKLYLYPKPLVLACTGHAMAMAAITMFAGDVRIGTAGKFKIGLNESSIGMALPHLAVALAKERISPNYINRSVVVGEIFDPETAKEAGYLDLVVDASAIEATALQYAKTIGESVKLEAFAENKRRLRAAIIKEYEDIYD